MLDAEKITHTFLVPALMAAMNQVSRRRRARYSGAMKPTEFFRWWIHRSRERRALRSGGADVIGDLVLLRPQDAA